MIDTHCHLEQGVYSPDREEIIERCKRELKAVVTCAPDPKDYELTFNLVKKYPNFVFAVAGIHPEYAKRFTDEEVEKAMKTLETNKDKLVGVGECGFDYKNDQDKELREKQKTLFIRLIKLAKSINLPVVVHIRDAFEDAIEILEQEGAKHVQLHMFGSRPFLKRVIDNGWLVSCNAIILRSKTYKKIVRDCPLERLMLETDAPWLHPSGDVNIRNDPLGVKVVAEKVAEIKKTTFEKIDEITTKNAIEFFRLKI